MKRRSLLQFAGVLLGAPLAKLLPAPSAIPPPSEEATHARPAPLRPYEPDYEVTEDVLRQTTSIRLLKYGRTLTVSHEAIRRQHLDVFDRALGKRDA